MSPSKPIARAAAPQRLPKRAPSSRLADERLQCVIELAADFYWEQDAADRFTVYRPSGEPDAELDGLVGKTSWEFFAAPPEAERLGAVRRDARSSARRSATCCIASARRQPACAT